MGHISAKCKYIYLRTYERIHIVFYAILPFDLLMGRDWEIWIDNDSRVRRNQF